MIQKSSMFRWGLFLDTDYYVLTGMAEAEAGVRAERGEYAPQILAAQLTLSQPGGQIMPTTLLLAHPDLKT